MPYEWLPGNGGEDRLHLWPHRSLSRRGFAWFIGLTAALVALPLLSVLGSPVVWALLPFVAAMLAAIWLALRKNGRDREIVEDLQLTPERLALVRHGPKGRRQDWEANPYWVRVTLHQTGGPVPNYLTLKGEGREVELGAFLSEEERTALFRELSSHLAEIRQESQPAT
jgi:uncharacterized membrane protein